LSAEEGSEERITIKTISKVLEQGYTDESIMPFITRTMSGDE
jgi:hypothetical protein